MRFTARESLYPFSHCLPPLIPSGNRVYFFTLMSFLNIMSNPYMHMLRVHVPGSISKRQCYSTGITCCLEWGNFFILFVVQMKLFARFKSKKVILIKQNLSDYCGSKRNLPSSTARAPEPTAFSVPTISRTYKVRISDVRKRFAMHLFNTDGHTKITLD